MVVDDHALFRRGLEMVLSQEPDIELVGEASDGAEAIQRATELMPDVVLMDVRMPKRSGIEAAGEIKDLLPHVKILMLTISDEEADLYDAIKAGASGYLLKEIPIEELSDAIRSVGPGQARISPSMASKLLTAPTAVPSGARGSGRCPETAGVRFVFRRPGEEDLHTLAALVDSSIRFITTRDERGAAFMADTYGALTGEPGVCLATLGPGAINLMLGIANAQLDSHPLVAIAAQAGLNRTYKESHQFVDLVSLFRPITKWGDQV